MTERCLVCGDHAPLAVSVAYNRTLARTTCTQTMTVTGRSCLVHVGQAQDALGVAINKQGTPTHGQKAVDIQG